LSAFAGRVLMVIDPGLLPQRLEDLGFIGKIAVVEGKHIEYILPPLCAVPAGPFLMGTDPKRDSEARDNEQPQHTVTLPTFEIARYPVTVAEYAYFVRAGQLEPRDWQSQLGKLDHPVVWVSWRHAFAYTSWLTHCTREAWQLPTEMEWEKAARGTDGRIYPWGDTFDTSRCNTKESGIKATVPVGTYPSGVSQYGVQDMAGNVWEWTSSRKLPYPDAISGGRDDVHSPDVRVMRGGSWSLWNDGARQARAAYRVGGVPLNFSDFVGFRLVRVAPNS
jgi:formylglycine-generating enzyme required for sulfatase activity